MKRFTATEKWGKVWFRTLTIHQKCFWHFLCDNCDSSGVWEPDFDLASFQIGATVSDADILAFGDRVVLLESGKYWLTGFINFQCGELSDDCFPHKAILKTLERHGIAEMYRTGRVVGRVGTTLQYKDKDKEKEKDKEGGCKGEPKVAASVGGFKRPTLEELKLQCAKIGLVDAEAEKFFNHYESNGWRVGKNPMKSWTAALSNWKLNAKNYGSNQRINPNGNRPITGAEQRQVGIPKRDNEPDIGLLLERKAEREAAAKQLAEQSNRT